MLADLGYRVRICNAIKNFSLLAWLHKTLPKEGFYVLYAYLLLNPVVISGRYNQRVHLAVIRSRFCLNTGIVACRVSIVVQQQVIRCISCSRYTAHITSPVIRSIPSPVKTEGVYQLVCDLFIGTGTEKSFDINNERAKSSSLVTHHHFCGFIKTVAALVNQ